MKIPEQFEQEETLSPRSSPSKKLLLIGIVIVLVVLVGAGFFWLQSSKSQQEIRSQEKSSSEKIEGTSQEARVVGRIRDKRNDAGSIRDVPLGSQNITVVLVPSDEYIFYQKQEVYTTENNQVVGRFDDIVVIVPIEAVAAQTILKTRYIPDSTIVHTDGYGEFTAITIKEFYPMTVIPGNYVLCYAWGSRTFPNISLDLKGCADIKLQGGQQLSVDLAFGSDGLWIEHQNVESLNKSPQPLDTDTSRWETYRDEEFGFELKYPDDLLLEENVVVNSADSSGNVLKFPNVYFYDTPSIKTYITMRVAERSCRRSESVEDTYHIRSNTTVNGLPFQEASWFYAPPRRGYEYSTEKDGVCYTITLEFRGNDQKSFHDIVDVGARQPELFFDIFDQILSTFRFIE